MKIIRLNTLSFVHKVEEHNNFKSFFLNYVKNKPKIPIFEKNENVINSDWGDSLNMEIEYKSKLIKIITPLLDKTSKKLRANTVNITNMWFQQYNLKSNHNWHYHCGCGWSAVYYVELPNNNIKTQLYDLYEDKIIDDIDLNEGDLFIFPSNTAHRSPVNTDNRTKTIISFNLDFDVFEENPNQH